MIQTLIKCLTTLLHVGQFFAEVIIALMIILLMVAKPLALFILLLNLKDILPKDLSFLKRRMFEAMILILFFVSLFNLCFWIYAISLDVEENLRVILYCYTYILDAYLYYPLGIPHNPLNIKWYKYKFKKGPKK
jgi:hypothetical protein